VVSRMRHDYLRRFERPENEHSDSSTFIESECNSGDEFLPIHSCTSMKSINCNTQCWPIPSLPPDPKPASVLRNNSAGRHNVRSI
jgi:hypothetical protein